MFPHLKTIHPQILTIVQRGLAARDLTWISAGVCLVFGPCLAPAGLSFFCF